MNIKLETHTFHMSKEAFFYAYKTLTKEQPYHVFLESGRGGHLSVAAWNPVAVAKVSRKWLANSLEKWGARSS